MMRPLVVILIFSSMASHIDARQTYRSSIDGVRFDVLVTEHGRPVTNLSPDDFEVTDTGVAQRVDSVSTANHLAVAFALDASRSVSGPGYTAATRAIESLLRDLHPGDLASFLTFHDVIVPRVAMTSKVDAISQALSISARTSNSVVYRSSVWDAAFAAASMVARTDARGLVVLLSDGMDNNSWLDRSEVGSTLARVGIPVDLIMLPSRSDTFDVYAPGAQWPKDISERTAGTIHQAVSSSLESDFARRFAELRQGYVVTYVPRGVQTSDGWHAVTIRVRGHEASVKARPGYFERKIIK